MRPYHSTVLLVDNNVVNTLMFIFNPSNTIDGRVTVTAVVHVDQGDSAFSRTITMNAGDIVINVYGYLSFC